MPNQILISHPKFNFGMSCTHLFTGSPARILSNGSIFVSSGSTLQHTGTVNVANAIAGLSGNITVRFDLFGGSNGSNGTFRLDNFTLNGYTTNEEEWNPRGYRYGFNGMEKDDEIKGSGNSYDFGARMYDSRVGRWLTIDALEKTKPNICGYQGFKNNPMLFIDPDGNDEYIVYKVIDERTGSTILYVPKHNKISSQIMTDGKGSGHVHSNNYYDFETIKTYRIDKDGVVHVSTSYNILYENGIKDFDLAFGSSNVKGKYHKKSESDGNQWMQTTDLQGSGGSQPHGITFTTSGGGASPTKQKSLTRTRENNIEDLLISLGALKGTSLGTKGSDIMKNLTEIVSENAEPNCTKNDKFSHNKSSSNKSEVLEIQTTYDHNGKRSKGPEGYISRPQADRLSNSGGRYNKTRDTIYTLKKGF